MTSAELGRNEVPDLKKRLSERDRIDHLRNALIAAINAIPIVGSPFGSLAQEYIPNPRESRLFESISKLDKDIRSLRGKDVRLARNCLLSGWDISMIDSVWLEHTLSLNYHVEPIKSKSDWESRVSGLNVTYMVSDMQFNELLSYCKPLQFGQKGVKIFWELFGALRIWEILNQVEINMQILTGIPNLPAFKRARYNTRPKRFSPSGGALVLDLAKTINVATTPTHVYLLGIGYNLGSVMMWEELLDNEIGSQAIDLYSPIIKQNLESVLEFCKSIKIDACIIRDMTKELDAIRNSNAKDLKNVLDTKVEFWFYEIESSLNELL